MGTLNSVRQRSRNKKVFLLVLNATLNLRLSIADVVFWQGLAIYFSDAWIGLCVFSVLPHGWGKTEHVISEWGFHKTFVAVTSEVANTFLGANASFNQRLTGVSAERHWPGGGGRITPLPQARLTLKPMTAARRARRRWKGLGETVLKHS